MASNKCNCPEEICNNVDHCYGYNEEIKGCAKRIHSIHRNTQYKQQGQKIPTVRDARTGGTISAFRLSRNKNVLEKHADLIVQKMAQDHELMEASPSSEQLRKEALRDMPQCLTVKRRVKAKLHESVRAKSKIRHIGYFKQLKYTLNIFLAKLKMDLRDLMYSFELWYNALKTIEGNFGSGVASFFKFMRLLFLLNVFVAFICFSFVVLPQLLFDLNNPINSTEINNTFSFWDIFTGQGYFTPTLLFYGAYSDKSVSLSNDLIYSMPDAYFFTIITLYFICFAILSVSSAQSYRKSFIETEGGLKNIYAHKIFCGWDYSIATKDAARLKSTAIYNELKELLYDSMKVQSKKSWTANCLTISVQITAHVFVFGILAMLSYLIWILLENATDRADLVVIPAIAVNFIMTFMPMVFGYLIRFEAYKNPKTILGVTIFRTFLLGFVVIGTSVTFWLRNASKENCWETALGQEIYRLIVFDFIFSVPLLALYELFWFLVYRTLKKGYLEFNVANHTTQLIYNQTLFFVGFLFSPLLSLIVVVKIFVTWYLRKFVALKLCKPSATSWRAGQTRTWFLMMVCAALLVISGVYGYLIVYVPTSKCGPFRNYNFFHEILTQGILSLEQDHIILKILLYTTKSEFIALILMGLSSRVYYLRCKSIAQAEVVKMYREMLVMESKDKEYLLHNISEVTKGQWQYKLHAERDPINLTPEVKFEPIHSEIELASSSNMTVNNNHSSPITSDCA